MDLTIRQFSEMFTTVKGKPFSLARRPWWAYIYDLYYYDIVIMGGRQIEKSTFIRNRMLSEACMLHQKSIIYGSATYRHVKRFYRDQWAPNLYGNATLRKVYTTAPHCINNQNMTVLANLTSVDFITLRGNGDTARGIAGDRLYIDEIQDITEDAVNVARQCLSHAGEVDKDNGSIDDFGIIISTGTPKTIDNILSKHYWNKSTAEEWVVKCDVCGKHNILGLSNISSEGIICSHCYKTHKAKNRLNTLTGEWVARYPLSSTRPKRGFRIPQLLLAALYGPERYKYKFYFEAKNADPITLYNEILGLSYEYADKPLNEKDFQLGNWNICNPEKIIVTHGLHKYIVGIDWGLGKSFTVIMIGYVDNRGILKIVFAKKYERGAELDRLYQLNDIKHIIRAVKPAMIALDWGLGSAYQNPALKKEFGPQRVIEVYNSGVQTALIKYNSKKRYYTINRDAMLENTFQEIRDGNIIFPRDFKPFIQDFLNIRTEYRKDIHGDTTAYFTHDEDSPDDAAHALNYLRVGGKILRLL